MIFKNQIELTRVVLPQVDLTTSWSIVTTPLSTLSSVSTAASRNSASWTWFRLADPVYLSRYLAWGVLVPDKGWVINHFHPDRYLGCVCEWLPGHLICIRWQNWFVHLLPRFLLKLWTSALRMSASLTSSFTWTRCQFERLFQPGDLKTNLRYIGSWMSLWWGAWCWRPTCLK